MSTIRHKEPLGKRRTAGWDRTAPLDPKNLELHAKLLAVGKPMSGRMRGFVYSCRNGRQHFHRRVIPRDPLTPVQRRSRAAFARAYRARSQNQPLMEEQGKAQPQRHLDKA